MEAGDDQVRHERAGGRRVLTLEAVAAPHPRSRVRRAAGFARPYLFGLASAVYLFGVGWVKWKNRAIIVELCRHFGYNYDMREPATLPRIKASDIAPSAELLDVREIDTVDGNVSERELLTICRLVRAARPRQLFEFGTFDGRTTLNLAANAPDDSRVATLDLPREAIATAVAPIHSHELRYADKPASGSRFSQTALAGRIDQLLGDSGTFDFAPYHGSVDFIFVDASHTYEYVINDSLHAIRMLPASGGTILWHDYSRWDGVTRALNDLRGADDRFAGLTWIEGTTLARLVR